jgi:SAM-dependent methyltransferase
LLSSAQIDHLTRKAHRMDETARYNRARWDALVAAKAVWTRPAADLDEGAARALLDPQERLGDVAGRDVLCLACGGGQQSVAFALLGARVTVVDLSEAQLRQDQATAARYRVTVATVQADMRDLSALEARGFDLVYHAYSLGFVPDAGVVFAQVARVLRPGGRYRFTWANPFALGLGVGDWNGAGYSLSQPYVDGALVEYADQAWVYNRDAATALVPPPREYRHTLSAVVNGLVGHGFIIEHLSDAADFTPDPQAAPGTWQHLVAVAPPWLTIWAAYRPDALADYSISRKG